ASMSLSRTNTFENADNRRNHSLSSQVSRNCLEMLPVVRAPLLALHGGILGLVRCAAWMPPSAEWVRKVQGDEEEEGGGGFSSKGVIFPLMAISKFVLS